MSAFRTLAAVCALLPLALALGGCVSKSKADAQARNAYLAGQQAGIAKMQQLQSQNQGPGVTVNGEVRNHFVPWTQGLTLAKAIMAAAYYGTADPSQILVVHNGIATRIDLKQLLAGTDFPLQAGDIVQLMPPSAPPR